MKLSVQPLRAIDTAPLVGSWHVIATTLSFWRTRWDPVIRYEALPDGRWRDTVSFRTGSGKAKSVVGFDRAVEGVPGAFVWRGAGWLAWCSSRWCFVDADPHPEEGWAVTWFSAATLGVTSEGWDVYARRSDRTPEDARGLVARVEERLGRVSAKGWFATLRDGVSGGGDALGVE